MGNPSKGSIRTINTKKERKKERSKKKDKEEERGKKKMNIKEAKEQIKNTVQVYLKKDENGEYKIPVIHQRPVLLIGAPGIGKTAIMEQVARECNIGLVAYTITHHTRQSAIGLPVVEKKMYGEKQYTVTEYTMSEIISSIYEQMEERGVKEGILFIDEINCVSETLAPTMLQFLQKKTFGMHEVPEGWIIVAAGNPPEYNKSVKEFDIVTLDRLKWIDVEPDYTVWREYAYEQQIHGAILSYLDIKKDHFYEIRTTVDGKEFATPRGWEDLSKLMRVYEEMNLKVDEKVIYQYLQHKQIAKDFANYVDLYAKYKEQYRVDDIIAGNIRQESVEKIKEARFDEKLSLLGLLVDKIGQICHEARAEDLYVENLFVFLKEIKQQTMASWRADDGIINLLEDFLSFEQEQWEKNKKFMTVEQKVAKKRSIETAQSYKKMLEKDGIKEMEAGFAFIKEQFEFEKEKRLEKIERGECALSYAFAFMEQAFGASQEMAVFVTNLTTNLAIMQFIRENDCEEYYKYEEELFFDKKRRELLGEIDKFQKLLDLS